MSHIHGVHSDVLSVPLTAMHRRRVAKGMSMAADEFNPQEDQSFRVLVPNKPTSLVTINKVTMIKNQRGIDCFAISILHLLGQTDFVRYGTQLNILCTKIRHFDFELRNISCHRVCRFRQGSFKGTSFCVKIPPMKEKKLKIERQLLSLSFYRLPSEEAG